MARFQNKRRISHLPNLITKVFIGNNVLIKKQNNICIGLKNYHVLMVLRQKVRFPTQTPNFGRQWEHILHKSFISGSRFKSTSKSTGLKVRWLLCWWKSVFWRWCISIGFKFSVKMWVNFKVRGEYFTI